MTLDKQYIDMAHFAFFDVASEFLRNVGDTNIALYSLKLAFHVIC